MLQTSDNSKSYSISDERIPMREEIFDALMQHADDAEITIEQRTEELQEAFLDVLSILFKSANIDTNERLVLTLSKSGYLDVSDHSQREEILTLFKKTPQCLRIMRRLAADALLRRGLQNIRSASELSKGISVSSEIVFQACFKGELSHFHLTQAA